MRWMRAALASLGALALSQTAFAQTPAPQGPAPGKMYRIGVITYAGNSTDSPGRVIKGELSKLGYKEGVNAVYMERAGGRDKAATLAFANEIVTWKPDVVVSLMTNANLAMLEATKQSQTPVVFWATDPVESRLVKSARKPDTNFTGFSYEPYMMVLYIRFMKTVMPDVKCVAHLYNHTYAPAPSTLRDLQEAGRIFNIPIKVYEVLTKEEFEPALAKMAKDGCTAVAIGPHELFNTNGPTLGPMFLKYKLAAVGLQTSIISEGGLAAYGAPFGRGWPAMAVVIDKILHGAKPGDIPVERGLKSPLMINVKAAKTLGLTIPPSLLDEADTIVE